ncbi:unnamed protein product [Trypanosoma congolense IL3000]|uniref:WGS project CAEQ00000000 data, annotated contig 896 n=1 Tax=Trypanosoma congolense (strain IL3000) TaxID=1068625 RepID=F9WJC5_TRYCI|nr:unnamed protein product [Trypanosoma congolense IL3000]
MGNCLCCGDKGRAHESDTEGTNANELATHNRIEVSHKRRESVAWNQEDDFATTGDSPNSVFNDVSLSCSPRNNGLIATAPPDEGSFASPTEDLLPPSASEEDPHADSTPNHALHVAPLDEDAPCTTPVIEERLRDISQEADEYAVPHNRECTECPDST